MFVLYAYVEGGREGGCQSTRHGQLTSRRREGDARCTLVVVRTGRSWWASQWLKVSGKWVSIGRRLATFVLPCRELLTQGRQRFSRQGKGVPA